MSSKWRRYEVLLPLRFNDGKEVPGDWIAEVVDHFGAASYETQRVKGHWRHSGVLYRDDLVRIVVDIPNWRRIANGWRSSKEMEAQARPT